MSPGCHPFLGLGLARALPAGAASGDRVRHPPEALRGLMVSSGDSLNGLEGRRPALVF